MQSLQELYQELSLFWGVYLCVGILFPRNLSVSRTKVHPKLFPNLIQNIITTALAVPFIQKIPHVIELDAPFRYLAIIFISEIWFYYTHRIMHHRWFYKYHRDHHVYIHPHALAGLYCSPIEMIFVNQLSAALPVQLLGLTSSETLVFMILVALNVLKGHSGLQRYSNKNKFLRWLFDSSLHDLHHEKLNVNYGLFDFMDILHGTFDNKTNVP